MKQRLLGAAVLIALAVIFVPMFLPTAAPRKSTDTEVSNLAIPPAPEREFQTRVLPLDPAATNPAVPTSAPVDDDRIATVDTATAPKPDIATPLPEPPAASPRAEPPAAAAAAPPAAAPQSAPQSAPAAGQVANDRFFVHLGVYGEAKNAADLVGALKQGGFAAFAEATEYQGKPAQRVRVGPFADRAAADAARLRIKQLKPAVPGSVVQLATDAKADAPAAALPANRAGGWAVQLGALKTEADANKLRERVKGAGFAAFVDKVESNGTALWRVRVGPEVDRAAADKLRASLKDKLKLDGMIVTQP